MAKYQSVFKYMEAEETRYKIIEALTEKLCKIASVPCHNYSEMRNRDAGIASVGQEMFFVQNYVFAPDELI